MHILYTTTSQTVAWTINNTTTFTSCVISIRFQQSTDIDPGSAPTSPSCQFPRLTPSIKSLVVHVCFTLFLGFCFLVGTPFWRYLFHVGLQGSMEKIWTSSKLRLLIKLMICRVSFSFKIFINRIGIVDLFWQSIRKSSYTYIQELAAKNTSGCCEKKTSSYTKKGNFTEVLNIWRPPYTNCVGQV